MNYPESLTKLAKAFSRLPGIGPKTAHRLALHLAFRKEEAWELREALEGLSRLGICQACGNLAEGDLCPICQDESRDRSLLAVVEGITDLFALERSGGFHGLYHVLGGALNPIEEAILRKVGSEARGLAGFDSGCHLVPQVLPVALLEFPQGPFGHDFPQGAQAAQPLLPRPDGEPNGVHVVEPPPGQVGVGECLPQGVVGHHQAVLFQEQAFPVGGGAARHLQAQAPEVHLPHGGAQDECGIPGEAPALQEPGDAPLGAVPLHPEGKPQAPGGLIPEGKPLPFPPRGAEEGGVQLPRAAEFPQALLGDVDQEFFPKRARAHLVEDAPRAVEALHLPGRLAGRPHHLLGPLLGEELDGEAEEIHEGILTRPARKRKTVLRSFPRIAWGPTMDIGELYERVREWAENLGLEAEYRLMEAQEWVENLTFEAEYRLMEAESTPCNASLGVR